MGSAASRRRVDPNLARSCLQEDSPVNLSRWIFEDLVERARKLTDYYEVLPAIFAAGHYGKVRIAYSRTEDKRRRKVAIKTVPKNKPVYVDMLRKEIQILR